MFVLTIGSCRGKSNVEQPLDFEKMVSITKDLTIAEAALRLDYVGSDYVEDKSLLFFDICKIHSADTADYNQTLAAYKLDLNLLNKLFNQVVEELTEQKSMYVPQPEPEMGGF